MMRRKDVALIAFRLLAIWTVFSGADALVESLISWKAVAAQSMSVMAGVANAPTSSQLLWMTSSALLARVAIGLLLWWLSPLLARVTCPGDTAIGVDVKREELFSAAAFLVGLWLVSDAIPGLAFAAFAATRPGTPAYDDGQGGARLAQLMARLAIGLAFLRSRWLVSWALAGPMIPQQDGAEGHGGVEQGDEADEAFGGTNPRAASGAQPKVPPNARAD
jgi:hypothetical protein